MAKIAAFADGIIFQFEDRLKLTDDGGKKQFLNVTESGIQYANSDDSYDSSRWGVVTSVGPEIADVYVGDRVLVTALKWTNAINFEGDDYWKTDGDQILAIDPEVRDSLGVAA